MLSSKHIYQWVAPALVTLMALLAYLNNNDTSSVETKKNKEINIELNTEKLEKTLSQEPIYGDAQRSLKDTKPNEQASNIPSINQNSNYPLNNIQTSTTKVNTRPEISTAELSEESKERLSKVNELRKIASQKDWDKFLKASDEVLSMPDHLKISTLTSAIRDKAPRYVFEYLLAGGAKFEMPHTFRVVKMDDVNFLKELITLGLDIHVTTRNGENAINSVVNTMASRKVLNFLLENNVEIKANKDGSSLLTASLNKAIRNKEAVYYAYKLVQYGVPVGSADFTLVQQLQKENAQSYELIQRNIPELIRN